MFWLFEKECPYCHEESFSFRELLALDYFNAQECKVCGESVRNDGFRQLLILPAVLLSTFIGFVISSLLPNSLTPFGFLMIFVLIASAITLLAKPVKIEFASRFIPDPNNDKIICVSGWSEDELRTMVNDFIDEGTLAARIDLHKRPDADFCLTFPEDIPAREFVSLINYLNYPVNVEPTERSIAIGGKATLNSEFQGIPESLVGKKAIFYTPENDEDHDVVYLKTEGGTFAASFSRDDRWEEVNDPRLSASVSLLIS
jgi:hypothetical protein